MSQFAMNAAAGAAASAAASGVSSSVGQAIGKPMEGLSTPARKPGGAGVAEINWVDFNYPPMLRIVHYRLDELQGPLVGIVRALHSSFVLTVLVCLVNFIDTIIIVSNSDAPFKWVIQSALHFLLLPAAALATFYGGYRGLCEPDSTLAARFKVGQAVLGLIYFFMAIVPFGCAHGLAELSKIKEHTKGQGSGFWTVAIILETFLWGINFILAVVNTVRANKYASLHGDGAPLAGRF